MIVCKVCTNVLIDYLSLINFPHLEWSNPSSADTEAQQLQVFCLPPWSSPATAPSLLWATAALAPADPHPRQAPAMGTVLAAAFFHKLPPGDEKGAVSLKQKRRF